MFLLLCHCRPGYGMTCTFCGLLPLYVQVPSRPQYGGPLCQLADHAASPRHLALVLHASALGLPGFAHLRLHAFDTQKAECRIAAAKPQLISTAVFPFPLHHASFAVAVSAVWVLSVYLIQLLFGQLPSVFKVLPQYGQYFFFFQKLILLSPLPRLPCKLPSCLYSPAGYLQQHSCCQQVVQLAMHSTYPLY